MTQAIDIEELSSQWLTEALGYKVSSYQQQRIGSGQMGATYRLTLDAEAGPKTLLLKVATGSSEVRSMVAPGYAAEVGFYANIANTVDVKTPQCSYAAISEDNLRFTLLLEDLAPRTPGVQAHGCTEEQARGAINNMAGLHASRWNDPSLQDYTFLPTTKTPESIEFMAQLTGAATTEFVARYPEQMGKEDSDTLQAAAAVVADWMKMPSAATTLLHGDYRLDNLMFGDDDSDVYVLDWQTASVGDPGRDLAFFLGTSLDTELRRRAEQGLIETYHQNLLQRGLSDYDLEQCQQDYRLGQLHATVITTIGCIYTPGERSQSSDAMFLAMAKRSCAAIRDLKTLDLL